MPNIAFGLWNCFICELTLGSLGDFLDHTESREHAERHVHLIDHPLESIGVCWECDVPLDNEQAVVDHYATREHLQQAGQLTDNPAYGESCVSCNLTYIHPKGLRQHETTLAHILTTAKGNLSESLQASAEGISSSSSDSSEESESQPEGTSVQSWLLTKKCQRYEQICKTQATQLKTQQREMQVQLDEINRLRDENQEQAKTIARQEDYIFAQRQIIAAGRHMNV